MTELEAKEIAQRLIDDLDANGCTLKYAEIRTHPRFHGEYSVIFDVYGSTGSLIDGPIIVIVNQSSGQAQLMEGM